MTKVKTKKYPSKKAASLRASLQESGRDIAWLARQVGFSRGYVSNILNENVPWTEEFQRKALDALRSQATVPVTFKGRAVRVPEDVYKRAAALPLSVVEHTYEEAWKKAWLEEHAASTLAAAAEQAWLTATALDVT